jgi:hypothetical protein
MYQTIFDELIHMLVLGPTGVGKSKFIEGLIRQLVLQPDAPAVILIDPGGSTAHDLEKFIIKVDLEHKSVLLDPEEAAYALALNPCKPNPNLPISLQARYFAEAVLTALEIDQQMTQSIYFTPQIQQLFFNLAYILTETHYTLSEAEYFLTPEPHRAASALIEQTKTESVKSFWAAMQRLKPQQRQQLLGLAQSRLLPFLTSPAISNMFSQRERALDFGALIEQGGILIANVESYGSLTPFDSKLLANLLVNEVIKYCFSRPAYTGRECWLILEECGEGLITTEIGKILRRARKQGLKVILLNQDFCSLREANPVVARQIWANTSHKVVFRDLPHEDLDLIALEFFGDQFDQQGLKTIKDQLYHTYFAPQETTRAIEHYSSVETYSQFEATGQGSSQGTAESLAHLYTDEGFFPFITPELTSTIEGQAQSSAGTHSFSHGSGVGHAEGYGKSIVPFYEFKERREVASREFWQLEELLHLAKLKLKGLKKREIAFKARGRPCQILKVPFIEDIPEVPELQQRARQRIFTQSGFYSTLEEIQAERLRRAQALQVPLQEEIHVE